MVKEYPRFRIALVQDVQHRVETRHADMRRDLWQEAAIILVILRAARIRELHLRIAEADEPKADLRFDAQARAR